jgi:hypothetical protein
MSAGNATTTTEIDMKRLILACSAGLLTSFALAQTPSGTTAPGNPEPAAAAAAAAAAPAALAPAAGAEVYFISPADGAVVHGPVVVRFGLKGMGIAPAGVKFDNTGHHHLLLDTDMKDIKLDEWMPPTDSILHFGKGQTETVLKHVAAVAPADRSYSAWVISPSEQTRTASISTSKVLPSVDDRAPQALEHGGRVSRHGARWKTPQAGELRLLLRVGRARELDGPGGRLGVRIAEGVDADDRVAAVVLLALVEQRLLLDLAALIAGLHRAEHAAALGDRVELLQHRLLDQVGQLSMMKLPWLGSRSSPGPIRD